MLQLEIRVVLCIAAIFIAGEVWWCEECDGGGFLPYNPRDHRHGCEHRDELR